VDVKLGALAYGKNIRVRKYEQKLLRILDSKRLKRPREWRNAQNI
jgi:hypothetical protein